VVSKVDAESSQVEKTLLLMIMMSIKLMLGRKWYQKLTSDAI
jgi:hypothetical protein